jgi:hypothetical protein
MSLERLKQEFQSRASSDPAYYFNPHWMKLLNLYIDMAYAVGYENGLRNIQGKTKPVTIQKEGASITFDSRTKAAKYLGVEKRTVSKNISRGHKCKGWELIP